MLLRVAIGGHFLYEGLWKIDSHRGRFVSVPVGRPSDDGWEITSHRELPKPFSAEGYFTNSSGPLRDRFRSMLDDPDGRKRLEPAAVSDQWRATITELDARFHLTDEQRAAASAKMRELDDAKEAKFRDVDFTAKIQKYSDDLSQTEADEKSRLTAEHDRGRDKRRELNQTRGELFDVIDAWNTALRETVLKSLTQEQRDRAAAERWWLARRLGLSNGSPYDLGWPTSRISQINLATMLGLMLAGGLLIIGLFSRLSALAAAAFLAAIYAVNPAPPLGAGLLGDPGHYFYVNKELIECLAALVLATIPTGRWLGVDALIRGLITRRLSHAVLGPEKS